jgi:hypothetical protein
MQRWSMTTYDAWKTHNNPADDNCEYCGASPREVRKGWEPMSCNGKCGIEWRDADAEYEARRDDR